MGIKGAVTARRAASVSIGVIAAVTVGLVGAALGVEPAFGFALAAALLGVTLLPMPTWQWAASTLVAAVVFPGLANLGFLPSIAKFVDIPLAWGVLTAGALHRHGRANGCASRPIVTGLLALLAAIWISSIFHPREVLRPVAFALLLGLPFALLGGLVLDPPSRNDRRRLEWVIIGLAVVQVPIAIFQAAARGLGDPVQGTLYGKGAGAHLLGAITALVGIWLLVRRRHPRAVESVLAAAFLLIPFLSDAKAVLFAAVIPALVAVRTRGLLSPRLLVVGVLLAGLAAHPASKTASAFIQRAGEGRWGKLAAARVVLEGISSSPDALLFGLGPASTVSRASFMTTPLLLREGSPLRILGLGSSTFAVSAEAEAVRLSGGATSFNSAQSSALGVLGDLGLLGVGAYLFVVLQVLRHLYEAGSVQSRTVAGMWLMFLILGLVFDWWEEPPAMVLLAALTGLALASERSAPTEEQAR